MLFQKWCFADACLDVTTTFNVDVSSSSSPSPHAQHDNGDDNLLATPPSLAVALTPLFYVVDVSVVLHTIYLFSMKYKATGP